MRVLAISSYGVLGGAELSLATFLEHRPVGVEAEALLVSDGPLGPFLAGRGVAARAGDGYDGRPTPARLVRFTRSLAATLERFRPDVVWATGQKATLLAAPACRARAVPIVWHKVDFSWDRLLAKPLALASSGVIGVSEAVIEPLGPLRASRLLGVVGPPLRIAQGLEARPDPDQPVIGTVARLVPYKGHHEILRAAALLLDEFPTLRVAIAGGAVPEYPGYRASLEALAAELGLTERLELIGFTHDVPEVLERLTVYVNATYRDAEGFGLEGLSGAMLEASLAGVPVVATSGGGTAEGVVDGETGTLVPPADAGAIAAAVRSYLRDPALAARVGAAGREFARREFAPDTASRRLFGLLAASGG
jgi:glycosyltransferase involved in cell wall biosynthesis